MPNFHNTMYCHQRSSSKQSSCPPVCRMTTSDCITDREIFSQPVPPAMAYIQWQKWENLYEPCKALECGTIFSSLDKPFLMKGGRLK